MTVQQRVHGISDQASRANMSLQIAHLEAYYGKDAYYVNDIFKLFVKCLLNFSSSLPVWNTLRQSGHGHRTCHQCQVQEGKL